MSYFSLNVELCLNKCLSYTFKMLIIRTQYFHILSDRKELTSWFTPSPVYPGDLDACAHALLDDGMMGSTGAYILGRKANRNPCSSGHHFFCRYVSSPLVPMFACVHVRAFILVKCHYIWKRQLIPNPQMLVICKAAALSAVQRNHYSSSEEMIDPEMK